MQIKLVTIGKVKSKAYFELLQHYLKLIERFAKIELVVLEEPSKYPAKEAPSIAVKQWLEKQRGKTYLTLLDEKGKLFDSIQFSKKVESIKDGSNYTWAICCGSAHGFDRELKENAGLLLSLSPLTFPHEMAVCVIAEQIFRSFSILNAHPYHNE